MANKSVDGNDFLRTHCPCGKPVTTGTHAGVFCTDCAKLVPAACDFCTAIEPLPWRYPARSFASTVLQSPTGRVIVGASVEDWCACAACAAFINRDEYGALIERVLDLSALLASYPERDRPLRRDLLRKSITALYATFAEHRVGGPINVTHTKEA